MEIPESKTIPKNYLVQVTISKRKNQRSNAQALIFCWLLPLLVKTDAATFEVNMVNNYQDIAKKAVPTTAYGITSWTNFIEQCVNEREIFHMT